MTASINDFSPLEQHILNDFQRNLPLSATPYAEMAKQLRVTEDDVLQSILSLQKNGAVSRIGPVFREHRIGVSTLAAMSVSVDKLEYIADILSTFPEINDNYECEHSYNLWFVVTASSEEHLDIVLFEIEQHTKHTLMSLPMLDDYPINPSFIISPQQIKNHAT